MVIRQHVTEVQDSVEKRYINQAKQEQLVQSVWFESINARRTQIDPSHRETFEWIFKAEDHDIRSHFRRWLVSDKPIFWISGKAGSGKSTLMKFLSTDSRTVEILNSRSDSYSTYTYFIWNSGSQMQKSIKGLYCSLLHQMLGENLEIVDNILASRQGLSSKRSPADWELIELEDMAGMVLKMHKRPVCLFIDGLDELEDSESPFDMKQMLRKLLEDAPGLKICLSGRPESKWKAVLAEYPSMRLQDLTNDDLEVVAGDLLQRCVKALSYDVTEWDMNRLIETMLYKAEGVFLWLRLAIKSLQRGLSNRDDVHILHERLNALPSELDSMYRSMWKRLGDDEDLYREQAALYFNLLIIWEELFPGGNRPTIFHLAAACNTAVQNHIFEQHEDFLQSSEFEEICSNTWQKIDSRCAGFLEVVHPNGEDESLRHLQFPLGTKSRYWRECEVDFLHRTAKDFLCYTSDGRRLLDYKCTMHTELTGSLLLATLCEAMVNEVYYSEQHRAFISESSQNIEGNYWGVDRNHLGVDRNHWGYGVLFDLSNLFTALSSLERAQAPVWRSYSSKMLDLLLKVFIKRNMHNFYEAMAESGIEQPILHFIQTLDMNDERKKLVISHFLAYNLTSAESDNVRHDWLQISNPQWAYIHTSTYHSDKVLQPVPQLLTVFELCLITRNPNEERVPDTVRSLIKQEIRINRNIFVAFSACDGTFWRFGKRGGLFSKTMHKNWPISPDPCGTFDIILEIDTHQLVNYWISHYFARLQKKGTAEEDIEKQKTVWSEIVYDPTHCHQRVLLVGAPTRPVLRTEPAADLVDACCSESGSEGSHFDIENIPDMRSLRYFVPTMTESEEILEKLDILLNKNKQLGKKSPGYKPLDRFLNGPRPISSRVEVSPDFQQLGKLVNSIVATSEEYVTDVWSWLRNSGHSVPSREDYKAFRSAKGFEERFSIMEKLNNELLGS
jgi:NACHT domain